MKNFRKNCKGTAEVIGTIMFIMILLFFFTNVYLWHDAATKDANQLNLQKINASFSIEQVGNNIVLTANGGSNIVLSRLWIVESSNGGHFFADLTNVQVEAGTNLTISFSTQTVLSGSSANQVTDNTAGGSVTVNYHVQSAVTCTIINTLGIEKSTALKP